MPEYNIQSLFRVLPQHTVALTCAKALELPQNGFLRENQTWIAEAQELKARSRDITIERVLEEMRRLAFAQTTDMVTLKDGFVVIKDTDSLTTEQKSAISQIRQKKDGELEVRFYDKQKALDSLAKYLGLFSDKNTGQNPGVQPQINIVFGEAPAPAAVVEGEVRELPEGGDNG